jgi:hypothetical protein
MDLFEGRESPHSEALEKAIADHYASMLEQLKNLKPEQRAALHALKAREGDAIDIIDSLRPVRHLLDVASLPQTPRVHAIRELMVIAPSPPAPDGFDDPFWTPEQMVLWAITGDRRAVHLANTDSRPGWFSAQERARNVISALELRREAIVEAADKLRVDGPLTFRV